MSKSKRSISDTDVEAYLKAHPDFFTTHLHLLESLTIPHPSGQAVSLIAKQLEVIRARYQEMEAQLTALIDIARNNDNLMQKMHQLTLAMLEAEKLQDVEVHLRQVFYACFQADYIAVRLLGSAPPGQDDAGLFVAVDHPGWQHFRQFLSSHQPQTGAITLGQARFLFSEQGPEVKSCALVPMLFTELEGVLAIGSDDPERFRPDMGHLFLTQLGEIVATRLISLIKSQTD